MVSGCIVVTVEAPDQYLDLLAPMPDGVTFAMQVSKATDIVHVFVSQASELKRQLAWLRPCVRQDAALWISWPKKASKVTTDVTEDLIRKLALPLGFVDVKVCAVSGVWSGLKLVVRKELRDGGRGPAGSTLGR